MYVSGCDFEGEKVFHNMLAELVGGVEDDRFEIEDALEKQLGARPMPFPGMDSV